MLAFVDPFILLQSIGWAIIHSFWQSALLWFVYIIIINTGKTEASTQLKHHLSCLLLAASFFWFIISIVQYNLFIKNSSNVPPGLINVEWLFFSKQLNAVLQIISVAYFALLLVRMIQFGKNFYNLYQIKKSAHEKTAVDLKLFTRQSAQLLGIKKNVQIWVSKNVDVPSVIGWLKPVILLPITALNQLSTEQAQAIILHELAHIKRNDYLINLLQSVIETILFFNPFVRLLSNQIKKERENCCDDWVLNFKFNKQDYANALLILEEQRSLSINFALAATNDKQLLFSRIKRLFNNSPQFGFKTLLQFKLLATGLVILLFILTIKAGSSKDFSQTKVTNHTYLPTKLNLLSTQQKPVIVAEFEPIITKPKNITSAKSIMVKTNPEIKQSHASKQDEYTIAYVNEALLKNSSTSSYQPISTSNKEKQAPVLMKIEEQQSGSEETHIYIYQLKTADGKAEIKPIILINKRKEPIKIFSLKKHKKRIAS